MSDAGGYIVKAIAITISAFLVAHYTNAFMDNYKEKKELEIRREKFRKYLKSRKKKELKGWVIYHSRDPNIQCNCPYDTDINGYTCGDRSAYARTGGHDPVCYPNEVSQDMIDYWIEEQVRNVK